MSIRYLIIAAVLAAMCPTNTAQAADLPEWVEVGSTASGTIIYARSEDLVQGRPENTSAKLWMKLDASKNREVAWNSTIVLYVVNCVSESYRMIQGTAYYSNGTNEQIENIDGSTKFVTPGSNIAYATKLLCSAPSQTPTDYR